MKIKKPRLINITSRSDGDLSRAFDEYDKELRKKSICPICDKPRQGVAPKGISRKDAGLCICETKLDMAIGDNGSLTGNDVYEKLINRKLFPELPFYDYLVEQFLKGDNNVYT